MRRVRWRDENSREKVQNVRADSSVAVQTNKEEAIE